MRHINKIDDDNSVTTITYLVSDQGNGGAMCDKCGYYEDYAYWSNKCPQCHRHITGDSMYIPQGGSDF